MDQMNGDPNDISDDTTGDIPPAEEPASADGAIERVYSDAEVKELVDAAAAESTERHLRLAAEYDNFRRRVQREKEQWTNEAIERFATDLLSVLDDFDRALSAAPGAKDAVTEGIRLTDKALRAVLARHGVEVIDPAGAPFDPKLHEAIQRAPAGDAPPGTVVSVFEKGYVLKGKLLRPARVLVAG